MLAEAADSIGGGAGRRLRAAGSAIGRAVIRPVRRARAFREDDSAQVIVLTGIMIMVVAFFAMNNLNSSEVIYNRIRAQTAVDAAADTYALWQARGFNLEQHLNDYHYESLLFFTVQTGINCIMRMTCSSRWCDTCTCPAGKLGCSWCGGRWGCRLIGCWTFCEGAVRSCCQQYANALARIETQQANISTLVLGTQQILQVTIPALGWHAANEVAKANQAANIETGITPQAGGGTVKSWIDDVLTDLMGAPYSVDSTLSAASATRPDGDLHVIPLNAPVMTGILSPPNVSAVIPPFRIDSRCLSSSLQDISCTLSTCNPNIVDCLIARLVSFIPMIGDSSGGCLWSQLSIPMVNFNLCDYNCARGVFDYQANPCGWHDTWWAGSPTATTWIAGWRDRNIGGYRAWFSTRYYNPTIGGPSPLDATQDIDIDEFDREAFNETVGSTDSFVNRPIVVMASSNSLGHENPALQPALLFYSRPVPDFQYCRPQLINVHLGLNDNQAEQEFLWH